MQTYRFEK